MLKDVIDGFKRWMTYDDVYSILKSTSKTCETLCAETKSLVARVKQLEAAEKSRAEAMDFITSSTEEIKPVCDDCVSMRLELDALHSDIDVIKSRLEAIEAAGKRSSSRRTKSTQTASAAIATDSKPKRGRRKSDEKKLDS